MEEVRIAHVVTQCLNLHLGVPYLLRAADHSQFQFQVGASSALGPVGDCTSTKIFSFVSLLTNLLPPSRPSTTMHEHSAQFVLAHHCFAQGVLYSNRKGIDKCLVHEAMCNEYKERCRLAKVDPALSKVLILLNSCLGRILITFQLSENSPTFAYILISAHTSTLLNWSLHSVLSAQNFLSTCRHSALYALFPDGHSAPSASDCTRISMQAHEASVTSR